MSAELFNSSYYASANSDLRAAGITTESQLRSHFQSFGLNEGRRFSSFCNLDIYKVENTDLAKAGLTSNSQLLSHLETYGVNEGRKFSEFVDLDFYLNKNLDINTFYQGNREKALSHLQSFGLNEGRAFSKFIDVDYYLAVNSDVKNALSGSRSAALQHLEQYGISENRLFSSIVDLSLYKTLNSDLSTLNNTQLFQHLGTYGLGEGRQFSYSFDLNYYESNNPDLISAYTSPRNLSLDGLVSSPSELGRLASFLLGHFEISGITEGRRSSAEFDVSTYKTSNADLASLDNQQLYKHFRTYGINEARIYSDTYDSNYYRDKANNTAPDGSTLQQLFSYYLLEGAGKGDIATSHIVRPNEIVDTLDFVSNRAAKEGILSIKDESNRTRLGTFSKDYLLNGVDAGQTVTINMTSTAFDAYLQIIDLDTGRVVVENNNSAADTTNSRVTFKTAQAGQYLVRATGVNFKDLGAYSLTATASSRSAGTLIVGSQSSLISSTLNATSYRDPINPGRFSEDRDLDVTSVAVEQAVTLAVKSTGFTPIIQLVNADNGNIIASGKTDSANSATLTFTRDTGIKYVVRTTGEAAASGGSFTLAAELIPVMGLTAIAKQQTINGALSTTKFTDTYRLDTAGTSAGDKVQVNLNSTDFNTLLVVTVKTSDGTSTLVNNGAGANTRNSELTLTIAANTTYEIQVTPRSPKDTQNVGSYSLTTSPIAANQAGSGVTLTDTSLQALLGNKTTLSRGDILGFFAQAQINGITAVEKDDLRTIVKHAEQFRLSDDLRFLTDRVVDGITNDMTAVDFETNLVSPLFFGTKPAIANYVGEGDKANAKNIPKPEITQFIYQPILGSLYGTNPKDERTPNEPRIRDINQGKIGDCAILGALGALFTTPQYEGSVNLGSSAIQNIIVSNGLETYNKKDYETWSFRFYSKDSPYYVTVDRRVVTYDDGLYVTYRGGVDKSNSLTDDGQAIWGPLIGKAYAEFRERTKGDGIKSGYTLIGNGDNAENPLVALTGRKATFYSRPTFKDISVALASGESINAAVVADSPFLKGGHAYSLTHAYTNPEGEQRVVLRNPWGEDGQMGSGNKKDGFVDVSLTEFSNTNAQIASV